MRSIKTDAIVLRRTNYGESDRIIQIITPKHGKLSVIAKGVRKEKSKLAQGIELFSVSELVLHVGKSEIHTLTSARLKNFYRHILEDYSRLECGYEILKKINKISEHIEESSLYKYLLTALASLDDKAIDERIIRSWIALRFAEVQGHGLNLSRDSNNNDLQADKTYRFDIAEMSFVEDSRGSFGAEHLKLLKILKLKEPDFIAQISGIEPYLDDCLSLTNAAAE
jgi:DNA repair protein RecO (recombination protein O)